MGMLLETCSPMRKRLKGDSIKKTMTKKFDFAIPEDNLEHAEQEDVVPERAMPEKEPETAKSVHFFEEFLILGIDPSEIQQLFSSDEDLTKKVKYDPKIEFRYPAVQSDLNDSDISNQLKNFLFPFGYYIERINKPDLLNSSDSVGKTQGTTESKKSASPSRVYKESFCSFLMNK